MAKEVVVHRGGVLLPLLTVLFVGLKLTGYIAWSWWWVLAPVWVPACIAILVVVALVVLSAWAARE